jgi:hypothetical protein
MEKADGLIKAPNASNSTGLKVLCQGQTFSQADRKAVLGSEVSICPKDQYHCFSLLAALVRCLCGPM